MITTAIESNSLLFNNTNSNRYANASMKPSNIANTKAGGLAIILKVMEDILRDGIKEEELIRAKTNIVNKLAMSYENTHTIAMYYNEMVMMEHDPIVSINDFIKGIKKAN